MTIDLPAGREIDSLVAEKIMDDPVDRQIVDQHGFEIILCRSRQVLPRYSTDIAAAWTVVEKLRSMGFGVVIDNLPSTSGKSVGWTVAVIGISTQDTFAGTADTAPLAIVRAALKALEKTT